ncbi:MAG: GNAT family N-acetyltransferase [Candidatus Latescibacterota bacterium]
MSCLFACSAGLLRRLPDPPCSRLRDARWPPAAGLTLPQHCFPDGIVYGVVRDGRVVSVAYAHRSGHMEGMVADLGVETAPAYRRQGFARQVVGAVVAHVARRGGEALYSCHPDNLASLATARSVGFVPYANALYLSAAAPDT